MSTRQRAIDILRGVAILAVVFHHLIGIHVYPNGWWLEYGYGYFLGTWLTNGWLGVTLFFILSGFVLFLPYAAGKRQLSTSNDVINFYSHRAKRLLPLYYISTFVALFILGNFWPHYNLERTFAMATITFNFFPDYFAPPGNRPLWSLGIEVWYSILFPLLALLFLKRKVAMAFLIISILAYVTRSIGSELQVRAISSSLIGHLGDFVLGMWIAKGWVEKAWWTKCSYSTSIAMSTLGFVLTTIAAILFDVTESFHTLLFQLGAALLIVGMLVWGTRPNAYSWWSAWMLEVFGMMCYSMYLWHVPLIGGLRPVVTRPLEMLVYLFLLTVFSWLSYRYIEFGHVKDWRSLVPVDPLGGKGGGKDSSTTRHTNLS